MVESEKFNVTTDDDHPLVAAEKRTREKPKEGTAEYLAYGLGEVERKIRVAIRAAAKADSERLKLEEQRQTLLDKYQKVLRG